MEETDVWRKAHLLIKAYGPRAEREAKARGALARLRKDDCNWNLWLMVAMAIADLNRRPEPGEPVN